MEQISKLTLEIDGRIFTISVPYNDLTVSEVVEMLFRPAMLAATYQPGSLNSVIGEPDDEASIRFVD